MGKQPIRDKLQHPELKNEAKMKVPKPAFPLVITEGWLKKHVKMPNFVYKSVLVPTRVPSRAAGVLRSLQGRPFHTNNCHFWVTENNNNNATETQRQASHKPRGLHHGGKVHL